MDDTPVEGKPPVSPEPVSGKPAGQEPVSREPVNREPVNLQAATWKHRLLKLIYPFGMWVRNPLRHRLGQMSIGVCAIVAKTDIAGADRSVLLVRHSYRPGWCLPGGGLHRGEVPAVALARELREEVGLELTAPPRLFQVYLQSWFGMSDYPLLYLVDGDRGVRGTAQVTGELEILEVAWFPARALPADTDPGARRRIGEWLGDQTPAAGW
jgi:8-oxo-dGTP pyrophosphatase MutT (NUDIX family)